MTSRTIAVITAGLSQPSSSRMLADQLAEATTRRLEENGVDVSVVTIELRDLARDIVNNLVAGFPSPALGQVIETVTRADGLIAVSPIFSASYSGLFKSFFDVLEPDALAGQPVLIAATGGTERHSLALEYALRPLFSYLHATVAPTGVFAASSDWGNASEQASTLPGRIERAAGELAALVGASDRSEQLRDPFALDETFAASIGGFPSD